MTACLIILKTRRIAMRILNTKHTKKSVKLIMSILLVFSLTFSMASVAFAASAGAPPVASLSHNQ